MTDDADTQPFKRKDGISHLDFDPDYTCVLRVDIHELHTKQLLRSGVPCGKPATHYAVFRTLLGTFNDGWVCPPHHQYLEQSDVLVSSVEL